MNVFPVKPGDWVAYHDQIAMVKRVYDDTFDGRDGVLVDLVMYSLHGDKLGRISPILGGPRTFEPCCVFDGWQRIPEPEFPIHLSQIPDGNGKFRIGYYFGEPLPNRQWTPPKRKPREIVIVAVPRAAQNFNLDLEIRARLMAAQELRDVGREHNLPILIERAQALEFLAATLGEEIE